MLNLVQDVYGFPPGYYDAAEYGMRCYHQLGQAESPGERARLLLDLALAHYACAEHTPDFHAATRRAHEQSAALCVALCTVEQAVARGGQREACDDRDIEKAAGWMLDQMAAEPDRVRRAQMLEELYETLGPIVEPAARKLLQQLPSPGMRGWQVA